jgi:hypothetical protein
MLSRVMTGRKPKPKTKRLRHRLNITLAPNTSELLAKASQALHISQTACIELALRDWFQKEGI